MGDDKLKDPPGLASKWNVPLGSKSLSIISECSVLRKTYTLLHGRFRLRPTRISGLLKTSTFNGILSRWAMRWIGAGARPPTVTTETERLVGEFSQHLHLTETDVKFIWDTVGRVYDSAQQRSNVRLEGVLTIQSTQFSFVFASRDCERSVRLEVPRDRYVMLLNRGMTAEIIAMALLRYHTINSNNNQLALVPEFYDQTLPAGELFASVFNIHPQTRWFCSLFPDLENLAGSRGSFFQLSSSPPEGTYFANPPYDEEIMHQMASTLVGGLFLDGTTHYTVLATIPVWDAKGLARFGVTSEWGEFKCYTILSTSEFCRKTYLVPQSNAHFINYSSGKRIEPCNIYFIVLSNHTDQRPLETLDSAINAIYSPIDSW